MDSVWPATAAITVSDAEPVQQVPSTDAIGVDGAISGVVRVKAELPQDRLILVRADRTDIELEEAMPDELNRLTFEISREELASGAVSYAFQGMSYGIYRVELVGYDYTTHQIEPFGAYPALVTIDAAHRSMEGGDFNVGEMES